MNKDYEARLTKAIADHDNGVCDEDCTTKEEARASAKRQNGGAL